MADFSNVKFNGTLNGRVVSMSFASLPDASQVFLADYGLKQYLQDGVAMASVEELNKKLAKSRNGVMWTESERTAKMAERLAARIKALEDGTPSTRERSASEPTTDEYRAQKIVAWPYLVAMLEPEGIDVAKCKPGEIADYVAQFWDGYVTGETADKTEAKALMADYQKQLAQFKKTVTVDLSKRKLVLKK